MDSTERKLQHIVVKALGGWTRDRIGRFSQHLRKTAVAATLDMATRQKIFSAVLNGGKHWSWSLPRTV